VIAELCRFGVPSWLGGFQDPAFPVLFAEHARAFARRFPWVRCYTPVSETLVCATASALTGEWNDAVRDEGTFVRVLVHLCRAHELAVEAILAERPDAVFVHRERVPIPPPSALDAAAGLRWSAVRPLGLDLMLGREFPAGAGAWLQRHGVPSNELSFFRERRAVGRRWLAASDVGADAAGRGDLSAGVLARYGIPLLVLAAPAGDADRAALLAEEGARTVALRRTYARVHGFAWPALTDAVGWERGASVRANAVHADGLLSLARTRTAAGEAYARLAREWRPPFRVPLAAQR
jgi:beta-glucosidase